MKLFALFVGGRIKTCNIELHDIFFMSAKNIEDTYLPIVNRWWGNSHIHLDSYIELSNIENYQIEVIEKSDIVSEFKLFFVNFGGYLPNVFGETHHYNFVIAKDKSEALKKSKAKISHLWQNYDMMHLDDNFEIDDVIDISDHVCIKLTETKEFFEPEIIHKNKRLLLNKNNLNYLF